LLADCAAVGVVVVAPVQIARLMCTKLTHKHKLAQIQISASNNKIDEMFSEK